MDVLNWTELRFDNARLENRKFDDKSQKIVENLLNVWDDKHAIFVLEPDAVLENRIYLDRKTGEEKIDWMNLKKNINLKYAYQNESDYYPQTFDYVVSKLNQKVRFSAGVPQYLAVVELDDKDGAIVRGVFKAKSNLRYASINPAFLEYAPKTNEDKNKRYSPFEQTKSINEFLEEYSKQKENENESENEKVNG